MHPATRAQSAFSLVELSIVLVILGLLVGGVLSGQSLIHAAQLRAVSTEFTRYSTAALAFRDKYFQNPGDINNATAFWGSMTGCASNTVTVGTGTQTCNGSGQGGIGVGDNSSQATNESILFWQHLTNAGLIEGSYTGVATGSYWNNITPTFGVNAPASKYGANTGWTAFPTVNSPACCGPVVHSFDVSSNWFIEGDYGNILAFGTSATIGGAGPILTPQDMWNIDAKMDDGKPGTGNIVVGELYTACFLLADGSAGSQSTTAMRTNVQYNLASNAQACSIYFRNSY